MKLIPSLLAVAVTCALCGQANAIVYSATTVGGPTFDRPLANGNAVPTSLSGVGTAVSYSVFSFFVTTPGAYTFLSVATTPTAWDNYLVLYQNFLNPASPLTNVIVANDDFTSIGNAGFTATLATGITYYAVTTGFANTDAGAYTLTINPIPEPETYALMGLGLAGLAGVIAAKRRQKAGEAA
jgi:hypothetical protein